MCKKIISLFLVIAILCSFMIVPASAEDILPPVDEDYGGFISGVVDFADWAIDESFYAIKLIGSVFSDEICPERVGSNTTHSFVVDTVSVDGVLGDYYVCQYCGFNSGCTADAHGFNSAYNQYVSSLQTDLGTTALINGGIRYYCPAISHNEQSKVTWNIFEPGVNWYANVYATTNTLTQGLELEFPTAPVAGYYSGGYSVSTSGTEVRTTSFYDHKDVIAGAVMRPMTSSSSSGDFCFKVLAVNTHCSISGCIWVDFYPLTGSDLPTTYDITINSRPASIIGDYGIIGDDGTIIKVDGNMIVDESTSTVFNPVTNVTNNYTDYAFDYSDRSYNLTLEDGSTLKVVYGDENVTIQEGDTIYNIYYLIPDNSGSGGESGGDSGESGVPSGFWAWWQKSWNAFTEKLFLTLGSGGAGGGASGGSGSSELGNVDLDAADTPSDPADEDGKSLWQFIVLVVNGGKSVVTGTRELFSGVVSTIPDTMDGITGSFDSGGVAVGLFDGSDPDAADLPGTVSDESEVLDPWRYQ